MKKKIYVATKARGFLLYLFSNEFNNLKFFWDKDKVYETNSRLKLLIAKVVKSKLGDFFGLIQRIKIPKNDFDCAFSYNRFLKVDKSYIICLENPTALFHYSLGRNETRIGKKKINKFLNDKNLRAIVCISQACYNTLNNFYEIPERIKVKQIYPLIPKNPLVNQNIIKERCFKKEVNCLYVSSQFTLKGGRDIIEAFKILRKQGYEKISLKIITKKDMINKSLFNEMKMLNNVEIIDFNLSREKLNEIYALNNILLNPSRQDSFSLVTLESIKAGNVVLSSDLYALPEMIKEGENGFLISPKFRFFTKDNLPNKDVWNNRESTIYSDYLDENVVNFLYHRIITLYNDRSKLYEMSINSLKISNNFQFNEQYIKQEWENLIEKV